MSLEGDIRTALLAMDAVTALVGTSDAARIRPYRLDDRDNKEEEHIIVEVEQRTPQNDLEGIGGLTFAEVTIGCRAMTPTQAEALAVAVKRNGTDPGTGLAGYGGSATAFDAVLEYETKNTVPRDDKSQKAWYCVDQSYMVSFSEDV